MTYEWSLPNNCAVPKELMKALFEKNCPRDVFHKIAKIVGTIPLSSSTKKIFEKLISLNIAKYNAVERNALIEFLTGIDYARRNVHAGKLQLLSDVSAKSQHGILFLKHWCAIANQKKSYLNSSFWFDMRVALMDAYTICHIFSCRCDICIFYGGENHANSVREEIGKLAQSTTAPNYLKAFCIANRLLSINAFTFENKTIIILGENHKRTKVKFADNLLQYLKQYCNTETKISCLVEKHISNNNDPVQRELTCNMKDMAIHKFRCDEFIESNNCQNIEIIAVDNRHYDLGFLRYEVLLPWEGSYEFAQLGKEFNEHCLHDLDRVLTRLM